MRERVLLVNTVAGKGSVGRIVTGIAGRLKEKGTEPLIAFGRWDSPEGFNSVRINSSADIMLHGVMSRLTDKQGLYSERATEKLTEAITRFDPDVIHLHNIHGYYLNYELLFSFLKNSFSGKDKKVIWTLHDCWSFTGHCVHFEFAECDKWKTGCFSCPEKKQYPASFLLDSSKSNYERKKMAFTGVPGLTLVTPSEWLKDKVKESFLKDYPVEVIPTGIDLKAFNPEESDIREKFGIGKKTLLLGAANPWRERKGFNEFLKLASMLKGKDILLALIGLNKKQAEEAGRYSNIIPLRKTDSLKEMVRWYSAADIYVNLTLEDTFPTTNIEAMACGTPVITYRSGGSGEALTEKTGWIAEKRDLDSVIKGIDEILSKDREELKRACIERAAAYSAGSRFDEYIDLYNRE